MRRDPRGLTLLDVLVALAVLAVLIFFLRMDWAGQRRAEEAAPPAAPAEP